MGTLEVTLNKLRENTKKNCLKIMKIFHSTYPYMRKSPFLFKTKTIELLENSEINIFVLSEISISVEFDMKKVFLV